MTRFRGKKGEFRQCGYKNCLHDTKIIDRSKDEFIKNKSAYYHKDCYEHKLKYDYSNSDKQESQDKNTPVYFEGDYEQFIIEKYHNKKNHNQEQVTEPSENTDIEQSQIDLLDNIISIVIGINDNKTTSNKDDILYFLSSCLSTFKQELSSLGIDISINAMVKPPDKEPLIISY